VYSRHMFVWLSFAQKLDDVIAGCEAAWAFLVACSKSLSRNMFRGTYSGFCARLGYVAGDSWCLCRSLRGSPTFPSPAT